MSGDYWRVFDALVAESPPDLVPAVLDRYRREPADRPFLMHLLRRLDGADELLPRLLSDVDGQHAATLLSELTRRGVPVPAGEIARLLGDAEAARAATAAAGLSGDRSLTSALRPLLADPPLRSAAAMALGRLGATECTGDLTDLLGIVEPREHEMIVVAIERMGDPAAVPALLARLLHAPDSTAWGLHHALSVLTGREPLVPLYDNESTYAANVRAAWSTVDASGPAVGDVELIDRARARLTVDQGSGVVSIDYDPTTPGSSWPRWGRSLFVRERRVYGLGSDCGTCEAFLHLAGWPADRASGLAGDLREALADVPALTPELIDAARPLCAGLRTGHYLVTLTDLDLVPVTAVESSWLTRRDEPQWLGAQHFQLRAPIPGEVPSFGVIAPTQPLDDLAPDTVETHTEAIRAGARPAAVALSWADQRHVEGEHTERFLFGVVLDGHHKLTAYTRLGIPARTLLLTRVEDCWGPPGDRGRWHDELTAPLRVGQRRRA
ncbi:HEAT repeat protein [Herbihabitans rhizosphaerae]|uniref:HEAT repeat protein n=2 Tax=Herbihabitans rhizosphaerae TaxID=1872711 RepID=A0A4Q7KDR4_9PSEU|nr:HEAT repeat protein [Herbihabitans rhizosphaerae]